MFTISILYNLALVWSICSCHARGQALPKRTSISLYSNTTSTGPTTSGATPTIPPGHICCEVFANLVALHSWYNHTATITVATVITEYVQYNNTLVPTATLTTQSSTPYEDLITLGIYNGNANPEGPTFSGIPTTLVGYGDGNYAATELLSDTVYIDNYTTIASPTPFMVFSDIYVFHGTQGSDGACLATPANITYPISTVVFPSTTVTYSAFTELHSLGEVYTVYATATEVMEEAADRGIDIDAGSLIFTSISFPTPYYSVPSSDLVAQWPGGIVVDFDMDQVFLDWLQENPAVLSQFPQIVSCSLGEGAGAPTVKIQVSELTEQSSRVVTSSGIYSNKAFVASAPALVTPASTTTYSTSPVSTKVDGSKTLSQSFIGNTPTSSVVLPSATSTTNPSHNVAAPAEISPSAEPIATTQSAGVNLIPSTFSSRFSTATLDSGGDSEYSALPLSFSPASDTTSGAIEATSMSLDTYIVGSQTISIGGPAVIISAITYSLAPSGALLVNGQSSALVSAKTPTEVMIGSVTATHLSDGGYLVGDHTISVGGPAAVVSGSTYSLQDSQGGVLVNSQTLAISTYHPDLTLAVGTKVYAYTTAASGPIIIESQTLVPGGPAITVSGQTVSIPTSGVDAIVINGHISTFEPYSGLGTLTIGSQKITYSPLSPLIVIASQTLYQGGPAITLNGQTLSIAAFGTAVIVVSNSVTSTDSIAGYVWSGIGGTGRATATSTGATSTSSGIPQSPEVQVNAARRLSSHSGIFILFSLLATFWQRAS